MKETLYDILGVEETATAEEIKSAYRAMAKKHHPDANVNSNWTDEEKAKHEAILSKVGDAYDILKDEEKRKKYDEKLKEKRLRHEQIKKEKERRRKEEAARKAEEARKTEEERRAEEARRAAEAREESQRRTSTYRYDYERDYSDNEDIYNGNYSRKNNHYKKSSTFKGRWDRRKREFAKEYRKKHDSVPNNLPEIIAIVTVAGLLNITCEMIYQMHRFKKTQAGKFVINHKKSVAVGIAVVMVLSTGGFNSSSKNRANDSSKIITNIEQTTVSQQEEIQSRLTLTRMYTIKTGDTLSGIAENARTTMNRLQEINNIKTASIIRMGATIEVPYNISKEDEEYYTETIAVEDMSLEDIAAKYETTVETLKTLNEESINYLSDGSYIILSDTLVVPKFPTIKEVNAMKDYNTK